MSAFCPVCQQYMDVSYEVCPHVALIVPKYGTVLELPNADELYELKIWMIDLDDALSVLTCIGTLDNGTKLAYFSPNPKIFEQAVLRYLDTGEPISLTYRGIWYGLGMEHDRWHERK